MFNNKLYHMIPLRYKSFPPSNAAAALTDCGGSIFRRQIHTAERQFI